MYRFRIFSTIVAATFIISGCGKKDKEVQELDPPAPVEITVIEQGKIEQAIAFFGNVMGDKEVKVFSTIPNRVVKINAEVGDKVETGDILAEINTEKIRQAVTQAEAGLESAQAQFKTVNAEWKRLKTLYDDNAISQSQYEAVKAQRDAAQSGVKQVKAALSTARSQLQDTKITAPISGVVSQRLLNVGDMAAPQIPMFTVVKMNPVRVLVNVIEKHISEIAPGQLAKITVASYPGKIFEGTVKRVDPTLNPMTRTAMVEIEVPNDDLKLRPGMFASVEVVTKNKSEAVIIPSYAIIEKTSLNYEDGQLTTGKVKINRHVYVVEDSLALKRPVVIGIVDHNRTEVLSGVEIGESVISIGHHNLSDSARIEIISE